VLFSPIAIVGRACVLPGALTPEQLGQAVLQGRDLIAPAPEGRWRAAREDLLVGPDGDSADRAWSDHGGYVHGFDAVWDPSGFAVSEASLDGLDPLFAWSLHCAREALRDAGDRRSGPQDRSRVSAVFGNLGFPSTEMAHYAEAVWHREPRPDPRNRFMAGGAAALLREALGLHPDTFCVDTACASSLYAIKLACDQLHDGRVDLALAGAVNRSDDLFLHVGFSALQAMSPSGRSRPFAQDADGLVPASGAGFLALKRLADARRDGDRIHGIIRGIGLSNDGRGGGFLAPSEAGQVRALKQAYQSSGLTPADISLLECHATGTQVGDATELRSTGSVFAGCRDVAIGSLKSNLGHLITAAGVAGIIKVLEAMRAQTRPPSLHGDTLPDGPFRLLQRAEPWGSEGPRIAGVSAFGFGGNNAHVLVSEDDPTLSAEAAPMSIRDPLAIVAVGVVVGSIAGASAFAEAHAEGASWVGQGEARTEVVELDLVGLRFPPNDLKEALPQQLLVLAAAREAAAQLGPSEPDRTGVFLGFEPDPEVCRYGARWRLQEHLQGPSQWLDEVRDAIVPTLTSAGVVGTMPNIPANRLNGQFDLGGASVSVSAGEQSGAHALALACRAVAVGELDRAFVAAVDLSCNDVHLEAITAIEGAASAPGDAAVVLVVERAGDAASAGRPVLALVEPASEGEHLSFDGRYGRSWAAGGLRDLVAAALTLAPSRSRAVCRSGGPAFLLRAPDRPATVPRRPIPTRPLRLPAHRPPVRIPSRSPLEQPAMQSMPSAPKLPPVLGPSPAVDLTPPLPAAPAAIDPHPRAAGPGPIAAAPVASPRAEELHGPPGLLALRGRIASLGDMQRQFIVQQAVLHERFLGVQQAGLQTLLDARRGASARQPSTPMPPAPPSSPPTPPPTVEAAPAPAPTAAAAPTPGGPTGPTFTRDQLLTNASGRISELFGAEFLPQDQYARQVRMPEPPLLLADRVTGLDADPASMGTGTIWTETDITSDAWYLHQGHMPAGIMIEAGQADLMLISYLGVDLLNRGERIYRLLSCELTYYGGLPKVGDTLEYDIHLDGHAAQGDIRLMFFHYECAVDGKPRLTVSGGQAGFFTDEELAASDGCLWTPETQEIVSNPRLDPPAVACSRSSFSAEEVAAFADGRPEDCFGPEWGLARTHTRTPRIASDDMQLLGAVTAFDPTGGPWRRGFLRSEVPISPDDWYFAGHFKNDPCMPGTLMFEGCLQALAFYLAALGYTLPRDGWRFEPVSGEPFALKCRGQVIPSSRNLTYEVFVEEVIDGPVPTVYADLLCTVDGLKAFHARRVGLQLVPAWPLDEGHELLEGYVEPKPVAVVDGFSFDYHSLLACAQGRPSEAFGPIYRRFDAPGRVARLPNPPYLFLSRITRVQGVIGSMEHGMEVDVEYDIPPDAWYFDSNGSRTMPFAVLLEAALQPCGWLASYMGCALTRPEELAFRNLDGTGTLLVDLLPSSGTLVTKVKSTAISAIAGMIIVSFDVVCSVDGVPVYRMDTVFGFFPEDALANQVGLPTTEEQRALLEAPASRTIDLTVRPAGYWEAGRPKLADPKLLMIDRVFVVGEGLLRAEKDVNTDEWFFQAHFFQDPVQPGSLGIEAMIQLLQWYMLDAGLDEGIPNPRFETLALELPLTWKYRGQVVPQNRVIGTTLQIVETGTNERGAFAFATASLWVDGKRIYEASSLGMRIVSGDGPDGLVLDPETDAWLNDHRPTWTLPALPMMAIVDLLADGGTTALRDVKVHHWVTFEGPRTLRTERDGDQVRLLADGLEVAAARIVESAAHPPAPWAVLEGEPTELPYATGELFHGPALHLMESLIRTPEGASSVLRPAERALLLDGATHGIPHDNLALWNPRLPSDKVAYPARIPLIQFFGPTPTGPVRCEVRSTGFLGTPDLPRFEVQLISDEAVWCAFELIEACFPKGPLGSAEPGDRRRFLRDRQFVPGLRLSRDRDGVTSLHPDDVAASDWLPGTVQAVYGSADPEEVARREHAAAAHHVHPGRVFASLPLTSFDLTTEVDAEGTIQVRGDGQGSLEIAPVRAFWTGWFDRDPWPVEDIYYGLIERFVRRVVLTDPTAFEAVRGRSLLYVANHQVGVESLVFSIVASGLTEVPTVTLAKAEHRHTWLGRLIAHCFDYPGVSDPKVITFFDRDDKKSLPRIIGELAAEMAGPGRSVMVHVEGTRALSCQTPVQKMSGAFLDMAMRVGAAVVPVRFVGGLPVEPLETRAEFPPGMGRQDIWIGRPMEPPELAAVPYGPRKQLVIDAINSLGPAHAEETPLPGDPGFAARVAQWQQEHPQVSEEHAVLARMLSERVGRCDETTEILAGAGTGAWAAELRQRLFGS
jgi:3-oxoacyl-(acyl-carrier-protein) synthase/3-hydroxymyristoyl/3-hydroxydecanoyl-(acyl carrier protein) dehydratase/1-acyl-sn-glycerol-3-phosphate acyltransferase